MEIKTKSYKYTLFITSFLMFLTMCPYFIWEFPRINIILFIIILFNCKYISIKKENFPYILFIAFMHIMYIFSDYKIESFISIFVLLLFFLINEHRCIDILNQFKKLLAILLVPSIVLYILVVYFDYNFPSTILEPVNMEKGYNYINYYFFVNQNYISVLNRFHSYFDEPGVLGTIGGMILVANRYNLRDKYNLIIFIGCILTFSFYFYVLSIFYILINTNKKNIILISFLLAFIAIILTSNEYFTPFTSRFIIEDGNLAGDNRVSDNFEIMYNKFISSSDIWFGIGRTTIYQLFPEGCSYKYLIVGNGIIFFVLYCLSFFLLAYKKISNFKDLLIWGLLFFSCLFQRPMILGYIYPIIWFVSIYIIQNNRKISHKTVYNYNNSSSNMSY